MAAAEDNMAAIRKQVEFYFSDANFRRDKFMQTKSGEDPQGCERVSSRYFVVCGAHFRGGLSHGVDSTAHGWLFCCCARDCMRA
jgi:hypothetical protein